MTVPELCTYRATELTSLVARREVSAVEVVQAHLDRVAEVNPKVNAVVTLTAERALEVARAQDDARPHDDTALPLAGLPVAHKDLALTKGVRTTFGSRVFVDHVPQESSLVVERMAAAGAIMIGKTNTPEFGTGSQTFNEVFGVTRNPYDLARTVGGSSGGAAAALAANMVPIADGSDMGGSLRNPASFCGVVGLRPSPGRVPTWPNAFPWSTLPVEGPMARTVEDTSLLLSAIAGPDSRSPIALTDPGTAFRGELERDFTGVRVAFSPDFGGQIPVAREMVDAIQATEAAFKAVGCDVEEATLDFRGADDAFKTWRAWLYAGLCGALVKQHREIMRDALVWNVERGWELTGADLLRAETARAALHRRTQDFMARYEFMVLPVTQVMPFAVTDPHVTHIENVEMETYLDWMRSCYYVTVTGHPAISVPCGLSRDGLPVGVQIVGRQRDDWGVLQLAYAFQQAAAPIPRPNL